MLGSGAVGYLLDLWIATAVSRPGGVLNGWTDQDIADEVRWTGEPGELLSALEKSGWIERRADGVVIVHDWTQHQGWASGSKDRSNRARMKALIKHHGEDAAWRMAKDKYGFDPAEYGFLLRHANSMPQHAASMLQHAVACSQHATAENSSAASMLPAEQHQKPAPADVSAPSPFPSPLPPLKDSTKVLSGAKGGAGLKQKGHFVKRAGEYAETIRAKCETLKGMANGSRSFNPYQWVQHWINKAGHPQAVIDSLDGLSQYWEQIKGEPWAYADKIMRTKNGNYHERDEQTKSKEYKKMLTELADLIGAL
ncbi:MAG: hypothetical protein MUC33_01150 [Desulfobacterales bacterium]|jgi:hypothetical protein|nr:hypothetical protein [Desulfobacterales bacterium]MCU0601249.1 hypothetical protein [Desulfobacterales bacterium]